MRNNTMFGTLHNGLNDKWKDVEENRYITLIKEQESYIYEVFSVYQNNKYRVVLHSVRVK